MRIRNLPLKVESQYEPVPGLCLPARLPAWPPHSFGRRAGRTALWQAGLVSLCLGGQTGEANPKFQTRNPNPAPRTPNPAWRTSQPVTGYPLMESFYSLQGEGFHSGKAAYFIRLGGCDVGCHWCDVKESWDASVHPLTSMEDLVDQAKIYDPAFTVITGGEPLMYDLNALTSALRSQGLRTHLETSGVYPVTGQWDWICFSPKKFKKPQSEIYQAADELKIIIYNSSDFDWAEQHAGQVNENCRLYLQPEWSKVDKNFPLLVDYVKTNPQWKISMQTHKYLNLP